MRWVLFICTGNYYRSRVAEAMFNHHARRCGLDWRAFSRGLALFPPQGAISPHVIGALLERGIDLEDTAPTPCALTSADLERAGLIIALNEPEHRPMMARLWPGWEDKGEYWQVPDLGERGPTEGIAMIEDNVMRMIERLAHAMRSPEAPARRPR